MSRPTTRSRRRSLPLLAGAALALAACSSPARPDAAGATPFTESPQTDVADSEPSVTPAPSSAPAGETQRGEDPLSVATFGAGCFWCVEAVLEQLDGVVDVESGYMGGDVPNPTYEEVCTGRTGHAEVVRVRFDPEKIGYGRLLSWFWRLHDPTTLNRQGDDVGTQYRSAIFYHDEEQRRIAEESKARAAAAFDDPIVTEITAAGDYWPAEPYHQDYYRQNRAQGYCRFVISPKLEKLGLEE